MSDAHLPVLLDEVINWLRPEEGGVFVDCTVGMAGHSKALLGASDSVTVIGIDRDAESLELATKRLEEYGERFKPVHSDYKTIKSVLAAFGDSPSIAHDLNSRVEGGGKRGSGSDQRRGPANAHSSTANEEGALKSTLKVRGILADFGISSYQLDQAERGFSFTQDAPLDMRMDRSSGETAADLVNDLDERELADLIFEYGEERGSRKIARAIVREREKSRIETTSQLANTVIRALKVPGRWRIHPATRTFQALRIKVNMELEGLGDFISSAISCLQIGGRIAIISFHSLEDRIVKNAFRIEAGQCQCPSGPRRAFGETLESEVGLDDVVCEVCGARKRVTILTRKPGRPSETEIAVNPRSRSARLRVAERIGTAEVGFSPT